MKAFDFLNPIKFAQGVRRRFLRCVSRQLQPFLVQTPVFWGDNNPVKIGKGVELQNTIINARSGSVVIEDYVFFGHNCLVLTGRHDFKLRDNARIMTVPESGYNIIIRRGAWIASGVTLIGPCEIGTHSVIVAGSIIRGVVPPGVIFGGNPAKEIRSIVFEEPMGC